MTSQNILVTGGTGYIAGHIILQLLDSGHHVRTTIRDRGREAAVRTAFREAGATNDDQLEVVEADLLSDARWADAVDGVDSVIHVASPVPAGPIAHEDDVIVPAREGTLRVLRAARDAGMRRVVQTSAFHAVGFGHPPLDRAFTEDDWSVIDGPGMDVYGRSKVLAERAAWDFVSTQGGDMQLTTLLPVAVVGPVIGSRVSGANNLIRPIVGGQLPGYPDFAAPFVDVRDVAEAHIAAITARGAGGERFLLSAQQSAVPLAEVGDALRDGLGERGRKVPPGSMSDAEVRAAAESTPALRLMVAELGYRKQVSSDKARRVLGFSPRPWQEAVVAAADSMISVGLVEVD